MKKPVLKFTIPIMDYFKTRRNLRNKFIIAVIPAALSLFFAHFLQVNKGVDICELFSNFIDVQISGIAILISFSIAIMTIIVSSGNPSIEKIKNVGASGKNYKLLNGEKMSLFQVLLSDITYNILIQIIYLAILFLEMFLQIVCSTQSLKYFVALDIFFLTHILYVLFESVIHMYLTFWKQE